MADWSTTNDMYVTKRDNTTEIVSFDKILNRIKTVGKEADIQINYTTLVIKVIDQIYDKIPTTKIDELLAEQCASMSSIHPDYNTLAGRIVVSNHHKNTSASFSEVVRQLYKYTDKHDKPSPLINERFYQDVCENARELDQMCDYTNDYLIEYFGFKTLEKSYLMRINGRVVERPQHMWMRVAVCLHGHDLEKVRETYYYMSHKYFTHATPTLFNAGTPREQLASCFLEAMEDDSIDGIFNTVKDCALISKWAGGIGLHIHNVRATGSQIRGTNGTSNGIVPMLRVFNHTAKYVDQGGGKRNGSIAVYLEPWHADIEMFLQMRKNHGDEELKARDLFYAIWIPDLFMTRVKNNEKWTLMCPDECPGLADVYGDEFDALYIKYEQEGRGRVSIDARNLWYQILDAQMETGTPYLLYKDAVNKKSNQKNLGTIKSSNLCVAPETLILTDKGHVEIQTLEGQKTNVWNGEEFSEVTVFKTGENQELIDVYTNDGCKLSCTKYHKFFIQNSYSKSSIEIKEAKDLKENDKILKCNYPVIDGEKKMLYAYTHGFFCGDGTYMHANLKESKCNYRCLENHYFCKKHICYETENLNTINLDKNICNAISNKKKPISYLYDEKKKLLECMEYRSVTENNGRIIISLPLDIEEKYYVPMDHSIKDKMEWFSGFCDADGSIANNGDNQQLQMTSTNIDFITKIKLMLQTCGINPKLVKMKEVGFSNLPDGRGGKRDFNTKAVYRINVTSNDLLKLIELGFKPNRLVLNPNKPNRRANQFFKISKIEDLGRRADTFCFTEPKKNAGIFNGILTSQCTEVTQYSDNTETATCNLSSIAIPAFLNYDTTPPTFDFEKLGYVTKIVTENLNRVIDVSYYPIEKARRSNMRHRPIGIGIQGLADTFILMGLSFSSEEAQELNRNIFETMYYSALERSMELSYRDGPYETFVGSPASQGLLQFDLWEFEPTNRRHNWTQLKSQIKQYGLRNSLLLAPMPTASTSQILGYNECIEPITSNIYSRRTIAGEFVVTNKYLMRDLIGLGLWNEKVKNNIIANNGSIQQIDGIPADIKEKFRTVWEIPMKTLINQSADRAKYICQSQSLNLWIENPNYNNLTSMHFYAWSCGLKTGIYYLRRRASASAQQFTIEPEKRDGVVHEDEENHCEMCSS